MPLYAQSRESVTPQMAVFPVIASNVSPEESAVFERGLQLGLGRPGYFDLISRDEQNYLMQKAGENGISPCLSTACYVVSARKMGADLAVGARLSRKAREPVYTAEVFVINAQSGQETERQILSAQIDSLPQLVGLAEEISGLISGFWLPRTNALNTFTDSSRIPEYGWQWGTALSALGAAAFYFAWDGGMLDEVGESRADSVIPIKNLPLSGIRGFYASRAPDAAGRSMGGAGVASVEGAVSPLYNPAGLSGTANQEATFSRSPLPGGSEQLFFSYSAGLRYNLVQAQALRMEGDELARELTYYSSYAADLGLLSRWFTGTRAGISLKGYMVSVGQEGIGTQRSTGHGYGLGADMGFLWIPSRDLQLGFVLEDPWSQIWYSNTLTSRTYKETIPPRLKLGAKARPTSKTMLLADLHKGLYADQSDKLSLGAEHHLFTPLLLRAGYYRILSQNDFQILSLGFGLQATTGYFRFAADYAWEKGFGEAEFMENQQIFSLTLGF